jgi:hypothetical protein
VHVRQCSSFKSDESCCCSVVTVINGAVQCVRGDLIPKYVSSKIRNTCSALRFTKINFFKKEK